MAVKVPDKYLKPLAEFAALEETSATELLKALDSATPSMVASELATQISGKVKLSERSVASYVGMLASLIGSMQRNRRPVKSFAAEVVRAAQDAKVKVDDVESFKSRLVRFLSAHALVVTAKALEITHEQQHVFCSARILTDLRPVFGSSVEEGPAAAVVVHTLRLTFHESDNSETKDFFLALGEEDLLQLRSLIERAQAKAEGLSKLGTSAHLPILTHRSHD